MQTFLPFSDYVNSAKVLDNKRLGKQRVEVLQILNVLTNPNPKGWRNHPAVAMWRGHESELVEYGVRICEEWVKRGFRDTVKDKLLARKISEGPAPSWIGDARVHASHRAILLRKNPDHYRSFGWQDEAEEYYWPVSPLPSKSATKKASAPSP